MRLVKHFDGSGSGLAEVTDDLANQGLTHNLWKMGDPTADVNVVWLGKFAMMADVDDGQIITTLILLGWERVDDPREDF